MGRRRRELHVRPPHRSTRASRPEHTRRDAGTRGPAEVESGRGFPPRPAPVSLGLRRGATIQVVDGEGVRGGTDHTRLPLAGENRGRRRRIARLPARGAARPPRCQMYKGQHHPRHGGCAPHDRPGSVCKNARFRDAGHPVSFSFRGRVSGPRDCPHATRCAGHSPPGGPRKRRRWGVVVCRPTGRRSSAPPPVYRGASAVSAVGPGATSQAGRVKT